jgi:hypothetical protein
VNAIVSSRGRQIHLLLRAAALAMLLISSVAAMPTGTQFWTEEAWSAPAQGQRQAIETDLSDPVTFNLSGNEPRFVLLDGVHQNYSDWLSCSGCDWNSSQLWIEDDWTWSRYGEITAGDPVDLVVHTSLDGNADLYLISYCNSSIAHWSIKSFKDYYHRLRLVSAETGRLFLLLVQGSEPANAVILDVQPRQIGQSSDLSAVDVGEIDTGMALITVKSERIKGFDVYVDGVFFSSDLSDGSLDGNASLTVAAGVTRTITVSQRDGRGGIVNRNEHTKSFLRETAYTLWIS